MRRVIVAVALLFMVFGLYCILKQPVQGWLEQRQISEKLEKFDQIRNGEMASNTDIRKIQNTVEDENSTNPEDEVLDDEADSSYEASSQTVQEPYSALLQDMREYNLRIYETNQQGLVDAWSYEQTAFDLSTYGVEEDTIGVLRIPAIEVELPIYLGATTENMSKGAAVLGQTSMPIGGKNTNCVIAGHRGYNGLPFLREIHQLAEGDFVYVTTFWEELAYQVNQITIIEPDNVDAIRIQEGRNLLTLITCHPYTVNTHRYVVYCSAVEAENTEQTSLDSSLEEHAQDAMNKEEKQEEADSSSESESTLTGGNVEATKIRLEQWLPLIAIPLVIVAGLLLFWPGKKKTKANKRRRL